MKRTQIRTIAALAVTVLAPGVAVATGPVGGGPAAREMPVVRQEGVVQEEGVAQQEGVVQEEGVVQQEGVAQEDTRTTVTVPAAARTAVLKEMRQMLAALNGVLLGLAQGEAGRVAEAARSGGTAIAVDRDPGMASGLPEAFARLGMDTHRGFDAVAEAADAGAPRDTLLVRLGRLTANCVSCHETYRLEVEDEGGR